ncbi:DUF4189 domain-containing protein [Methylosinus sp. PW1]|uniref:DUF4189 domain-containing protein n=1 Tax=Methylosinus sp. PW1 TaxID=107636 RepID=UPI000564181B|nr:DUF4189 domain-containing protein [Methylosinus sp. PW1]
MHFFRNKNLLACSVALWAGLFAPLARADSLGVCLQSCNNLAECDPAGGGANCSSAQHLCQSRCQLQPDSRDRVTGADRYGAIVYDTKTRVFGTAWDWGSAVEAIRAAHWNCSKFRGQRCEWDISVVNGCAVVVSSGDGGKVLGNRSNGGGASIREIVSAALSECAAQGGRDCVVRAKICSDGEP